MGYPSNQAFCCNQNRYFMSNSNQTEIYIYIYIPETTF